MELAQYREMEAFAQFGSDLDESTKKLLDRGSRLTELLKQKQYSPLSVVEQIIVIFAGVNGYLDAINLNKIVAFEEQLIRDIKLNKSEFIEEISTTKKISPQLEEKLKSYINDFATSFK